MACASCGGAKNASMRQTFLGSQPAAPTPTGGVVRPAAPRPKVAPAMSMANEPFIRPAYNNPAVETVDDDDDENRIVMVIGEDGVARPLEDGETFVLETTGRIDDTTGLKIALPRLENQA